MRALSLVVLLVGIVAGCQSDEPLNQAERAELAQQNLAETRREAVEMISDAEANAVETISDAKEEAREMVQQSELKLQQELKDLATPPSPMPAVTPAEPEFAPETVTPK